MEIRFEKRNTGAGSADGRAHSRGNDRRRVTFAASEDPSVRSGVRTVQREERGERASFRSGIEIGKYGIMFSLFVFAGMILFMLSGYEKISRSYQEVNAINAEIEETRLSINALEVAIECAVTIEQAQQWAKAHNMQYPLQSQYVVSGSSVPVTRGGSSGTAAGTPAGN